MIRFLVAGLAAVFIITACGYKGALVLPEAPVADSDSTEKSTKRKTP